MKKTITTLVCMLITSVALAETSTTDFVVTSDRYNLVGVVNQSGQKAVPKGTYSYHVKGLNRDSTIPDQTSYTHIYINDHCSCFAFLHWNADATSVVGEITYNINGNCDTYPVSNKYVYSKPFTVSGQEYRIKTYFAHHYWLFCNMYIYIYRVNSI